MSEEYIAGKKGIPFLGGNYDEHQRGKRDGGGNNGGGISGIGCLFLMLVPLLLILIFPVIASAIAAFAIAGTLTYFLSRKLIKTFIGLRFGHHLVIMRFLLSW